jgi:deoxyadenosine/deoxycytidine kinase
MLVLLEGNIAAGKTTLGQMLAASNLFQFIPEPVDRWQTGFAANLLERFYSDTPRWAFTLQICAFVTRAQTLEKLPDHQGLIFERSIYCDRYVFAKSLHKQGLMDDTEWALYCHFWEFLSGSVPVPDAIIYLRTPADECFRRLQIRGRAEEHNITLDYLTQLEISHDEWLMGTESLKMPVIVLDGMQTWTAESIWQKLEQVTV